MVSLTNGVFVLLFGCFGCLMVIARSKRQVVAITLAGILAATLVSPPQASAQGSLVGVINSVLNLINGKIQTVLNAINSVRTTISNLYQQAIFPISLINQARAMVSQTISQYRTALRSLYALNLSSATLPTPLALETVIRNHSTADFATLSTSFTQTFGAVPAQAVVSPSDRTMVDMDDATAVDNLMMLKQTDAATDLALQAADRFEDAAAQAAPGSAPFLTTSAILSSVHSQALIQRMIAAQLRQEAALLAHSTALIKRQATFTGDVNNQILKLLQQR